MSTIAPQSSRGLHHQGAFTLVELLVVVVLLGVVIAGLTGVIVRQLRFYSAASGITEVRGNLRQVADILPSELRGLSPASGDIYAMTSSSLDFRALVGASIVCSLEPGRRSVTIPVAERAVQSGMTSWITTPQPGDSLMLYDDSLRTWQRLELTGARTAGIQCAGPLSRTAGTAGMRLTLSDTVSSGTTAGAAVRFYRRARYALYQAPDGRSYLVYTECLPRRAPACSAIQPFSGPYLPNSGAAGGLTLGYFDSSGNATVDPASVARIDIVARAETEGVIQMDGTPGGIYRDSLSITVAVRNR